MTEGRRASALCLAAVGLPLLATAVSRMVFPYDTGHGEALVWEPARLLASGQNPYDLDRITHPPYVISGYGPFYYGLIGLGLRLFGLQLWAGRLLSLLGCGVAAFFVGKLALRFTGLRPLAALSAVAFLVQFPVQLWVGIQRPDFIALALALAGVDIALTALHGAGRRGWVVRMTVAALLLAAAVLTRQTSFLPGFVVGAWCLGQRRWKAASVFAAAFAVAVALPVAFLQAASRGGFLVQTWMMPASLPKRSDLAFGTLMALFTAPATWLLAAILALAAAGAGRRSAWNRTTLGVLVLVAVSVLMSVGTSSVPGSNVNYYLETAALLAILVAPAARLLATSIGADRTRFAALAAGLFALASLPTTARIARGEYYRWLALGYLQEIVQVMARDAPPGAPAFSVWPEMVVASGHRYYVNNWVAYTLWPDAHRDREGRLAGWPSLLARTYDSLIASCELGALVTHSLESPPGYRRATLHQPPPSRFSQAFLHLRVCPPRAGADNHMARW